MSDGDGDGGEEFPPAVPLWLGEALAVAPQYHKPAEVTANRLEHSETWVSDAGDELTGAAGDWRVSDGHSVWTVAADVFGATYTEVAPGRFRKTARIRAVRVDRRVEVRTLEGVAVAEPGDWVALNPTGEMWPIPAEVFARSYAEVGGEA